MRLLRAVPGRRGLVGSGAAPKMVRPGGAQAIVLALLVCAGVDAQATWSGKVQIFAYSNDDCTGNKVLWDNVTKVRSARQQGKHRGVPAWFFDSTAHMGDVLVRQVVQRTDLESCITSDRGTILTT